MQIDAAVLSKSGCAICPAFQMKVCKAASLLFPSYRPAADLAPTWSKTPARRTVVHPDALADSVPVICNGWSVRTSIGRPQILDVLLPGDMADPLAAFGAPNHWSVQSVTESVCAFFNRGALQAFLRTAPDALRTLSAVLIARSTSTDALIRSLAREGAEQRVARLVVNVLAALDARGMALLPEQKYPFPLRQYQIGDALGLSHVHVNKVLRWFKDHRLMDIRNREIHIMDIRRLKALASGGI